MSIHSIAYTQVTANAKDVEWKTGEKGLSVQSDMKEAEGSTCHSAPEGCCCVRYKFNIATFFKRNWKLCSFLWKTLWLFKECGWTKHIKDKYLNQGPLICKFGQNTKQAVNFCGLSHSGLIPCFGKKTEHVCKKWKSYKLTFKGGVMQGLGLERILLQFRKDVYVPIRLWRLVFSNDIWWQWKKQQLC